MAIPFLYQLQVVLTGNGSGTMRYTIPNTEKMTIDRIVFKSTGAFNITDIVSTSGQHYTNASAGTPIPSVVLASGANNNNNIGDLPLPVEMESGEGIIIDVTDTSGSGNTVQFTLVGTRDKAA